MIKYFSRHFLFSSVLYILFLEDMQNINKILLQIIVRNISYLNLSPFFRYVFVREVKNDQCLMFFPLAQQPNAGQGRLILEVSRSHTMTHHSR